MVFAKELMALKNPYKKLSTADELVEHRAALDTLESKEKNILATRIIEGCPISQFKQYRDHINDSRHEVASYETFHSVLDEAYQVRQGIEALVDPCNNKPYEILAVQFNLELFRRFADLAHYLIQGNESLIAERLALCASKYEKIIIEKVLHAFPKTDLVPKIKTVFALYHHINTLLLGNEPEKFFTHPDFNIKTCTQFISLFRILLKGREHALGLKLYHRLNSEERIELLRNLDLMSTELFDHTNPFKWIASSINIQENEQNTHSHTWFSPLKSETQDSAEKEEAGSILNFFNTMH